MRTYNLLFSWQLIVVAAMVLTSCGDDSNSGPVPLVNSFFPDRGTVGTEIVINGINFGSTVSNTTVAFNGVVAEILILNDSMLITEVPEGATTGRISVFNGQDTGNSPADFTVVVNPWNRIKSFPARGRNEAIAFTVNGKGYAGLGTSVSTYFKDIWEYDPSANTWTQKGDFPGSARAGAVGFTISSIGYIALGNDENDNRSKELWAYNAATDTWTRKADFAGDGKYGASCFVINNKAYVGCGNPAYEVGWGSVDFWEYDPVSDQWTQKADFDGERRYNAVAFALGGKGYIGTGELSTIKKDLWEYDPSSDQWTQKADFGGGIRTEAVAFVVNEQAYAGTGKNNSTGDGLKDFWKYDHTNNIWTQVTDYFGGDVLFSGDNGQREGAISFVIGGKAYVGLGDGYIHSNSDIWQYTPE